VLILLLNWGLALAVDKALKIAFREPDEPPDFPMCNSFLLVPSNVCAGQVRR
jgi:hypothetical protein